jgi:hypothetical protein
MNVNAGIANTVHAAVFTCSICGEPSANICAYCTKDACANHRCERCKRCSDCCECDVPLSAEEAVTEFAPEVAPAAEPSVFAEPLESADPQEPTEPRDLDEPLASTEPTEPGA